MDNNQHIDDIYSQGTQEKVREADEAKKGALGTLTFVGQAEKEQGCNRNREDMADKAGGNQLGMEAERRRHFVMGQLTLVSIVLSLSR